MIKSVLGVSFNSVFDRIWIVFKQPPIRLAPSDREIDGDLPESRGCCVTKQLITVLFDPIWCDVAQETEAGCQDSSVLCAISVF